VLGRVEEELMKSAVADLALQRLDGEDGLLGLRPPVLRLQPLLDREHQRIDPVFLLQPDQLAERLPFVKLQEKAALARVFFSPRAGSRP
jgi:hypothetical protein